MPTPSQIFRRFFHRRKTRAKKRLTSEQSSPLFRIMSVYDDADPTKRGFDANVCAFHIGSGIILSVAHYGFQPVLPGSIPDTFFQNEIIAKLPPAAATQARTCFVWDSASHKWRLSISDPKARQELVANLQAQRCDTRLQTLHSKGICKPFLIINFENNQFFNNTSLTSKINPAHIFHEPGLGRHTFLLELKLVNSFPKNDIAVYRVVNAPPNMIQVLPSIAIDYRSYDDSAEGIYCLQSSPSNSNLGRLLNRAWIDGILDHHSVMPDGIGGSHVADGMRYLIRGYFRFGSSGAA